MTEERRRIAVACQGGGSHTAFTAGVLDRLFADPDPDEEVVALSGTSGGAIAAFLAWYGLASADDEAAGRERARTLLANVWDDIAATDPAVAAANRAGVWWADARDGGLPLPAVSPYDAPVAGWTERYLRRALERAVPPADLARVVRRAETGGVPMLRLGAVDVERGTFRTFTEGEVTVDAVLASAALPTLFRAVTVEGDAGPRQYWDGLFSQNPPVRDLLAGVPRDRKPEEIWLIRINPQRRDSVPTALESIVDRRNELGGNLSLNQELAFVRRVNEWVADGSLADDYRPVTVRTVGLDGDRLSPPRELGAASKLDCRPGFVAELQAAGRAAADGLRETERNRRVVRGVFDAVWNAESPAAGAYLADDFELHAAGAPDGTGPAVYEAYVGRVRAALDGLDLRIDADVADGDRVALVWTARGRHVGRLFGAAATDRRVVVRGVQIARVGTDGAGEPVVAEAWLAADDAGFLAGDAAGAEEGDDGEPGSGPAGGDVPVPKTRPTPVVADLASAAEARRLAVGHAERLWGGDGVGPAAFVARDHVFHRAAEDVEGRDAYASFVAEYRAAFPDLRVSVRDAVAEGDRVVVRAAMTGTHRGPFEGVEPTGRRVEAHWAFVHELADGLIVATGMVEGRGWLREQVRARPLGEGTDDEDDGDDDGGTGGGRVGGAADATDAPR